jgi:mono/diheme cytochrome c family protein
MTRTVNHGQLSFALSLFILCFSSAFSAAQPQAKQVQPNAMNSAEADGKAKSTPTFSEDIAPIVFTNCSACHRPGQSAPFSLLNYADVKAHAKSIVRVTQSGYMPPWKPARDFGAFSNERFLTDEQKASIKQWVETGCPEGDPKTLPALPAFNSEWRLGKPDIVLKTNDVYTVAADGPDIYRAFVIPTNFDADKYISAVEYRTSNRRVVHHALFFEDISGEARRKDAADKGPGYSTFGGPGFIPVGGLGGWAPGNDAPPLPPGVVRVLYKGSDVVIQLHYHPTGKEEKEQSEVGIYLSKVPPKDILLSLMARSRDINIAPGEKGYQVHTSAKVPVDLKLINVTPHAHLICKSIKAVAKKPDGTVEPIIWIKDWDFRWQGQYTFAKPVSLPKDTIVESDFVYDNSDQNSANPSNPPKRVHWGEQTTDEMAILFCGVVTKDPKDVPVYRKAMFSQAVGSVARNPQLLLKLLELRKSQTRSLRGIDSGQASPAEP